MFRSRISALLLILAAAAIPSSAQQPITWTTNAVALDTDVVSWARLVQAKDGSWLAAYTLVTTVPSRIRVKRSFDKMRTWQTVAEIGEDGRDLDNATLCLRPDGTVLLAARSVVVGKSYFIETYQSIDNGNSFQYQSQVEWDHQTGGVYEPYLYALPNGNILCFYTSEVHRFETPAYSQILGEKVSTDGGLTWGPEIFAIAQPGFARPGEANIVPLPGSVLALFYEMCGSENCVGHVSYSTDGVTWPGIGPVVPQTFQNVQAIGLQSGLIVATSNLREIVISNDSTNSWIDTRKRPFAFGSWPGLYESSPGEVAMVMTAAGDQGENGAYIRFGTVDLNAIKAGSGPNPCRNPTFTRPQSCY